MANFFARSCHFATRAGNPFRAGRPTGRWTYRDKAGAALFAVLRFDKPDGDKEFRPLTLWRETQGLRWRWKSVPTPRPLYNLHKLAARPDAPVVICEGEKSADAAAADFPEIGGDDFARGRERGRQDGLEPASRAQGSDLARRRCAWARLCEESRRDVGGARLRRIRD